MNNDNLLTIQSKLKFPLKNLPIKMTLIRTENGIILISPLPNIHKFIDEINYFGNVTDIIAPNLFDHFGIKPAIKAYPNARIWGVEGCKEKVPDIEWQIIDSQGKWPYHNELSLIPILGIPKMNEIVFVHKASNSLILTDLSFSNVNPKGIGHWIKFKCFGNFKMFVKDQVAFKRSLHNVLNTDFDNIIISHGKNVMGDGKQILNEALQGRCL